MSKRTRLRGEHREWVVNIGDTDVAVEGFPCRFVVEAADDGFIVDDGQQRACAVAAVDGDTIWVALGSEVFEFQLLHGRGGASALDHDALRPPMSATVTRIAVKPGDIVTTGDVLVSLEAMKMELPIRAPHDGVIRAVNCREGDLVQPGQQLIDM
ncbi:MAG TPA: biotin/lipoyl-containing protein [Vicinamibacterales bacterium]|nr:biotin/lipoyl-containing protein [Vicinamibacterales bacterium]